MRTTAMTIGVVVTLALASCGGDDNDDTTGANTGTGTGGAAQATDTGERTTQTERPERTGTRITVGDSEFGSMLFGPDRQAIYIFERDSRDRTVCYAGCAAAWPPVLTNGKPRAGRGVRQSLLGTIERRDGKQQVTYAGQPLYYYAHEPAGEVRCHNVNLNGGLWWVVGPNGRHL